MSTERTIRAISSKYIAKCMTIFVLTTLFFTEAQAIQCKLLFSNSLGGITRNFDHTMVQKSYRKYFKKAIRESEVGWQSVKSFKRGDLIEIKGESYEVIEVVGFGGESVNYLVKTPTRLAVAQLYVHRSFMRKKLAYLKKARKFVNAVEIYDIDFTQKRALVEYVDGLNVRTIIEGNEAMGIPQNPLNMSIEALRLIESKLFSVQRSQREGPREEFSTSFRDDNVVVNFKTGELVLVDPF